MVNKRAFAILICIAILVSLCACGSQEQKNAQSEQNKEDNKQLVEIVMEEGSVMEFELYPDVAPETVKNFVKLASEGFYDGLTFHRIIKGFMIQGGDPEGTGMGGSKDRIKGEFSANGFKNDLKHERGVISMARSGDPNSASSQFFIMHEDAPHLDGSYAAFGKMISGFEVLDKLGETPVEDANGTVARENQPVIKTITVK